MAKMLVDYNANRHIHNSAGKEAIGLAGYIVHDFGYARDSNLERLYEPSYSPRYLQITAKARGWAPTSRLIDSFPVARDAPGSAAALAVSQSVVTNHNLPITAASSATKGTDAVAPDEFQCPISLELMEDPVVAADGHSYEKKEIEAWFASGRNTSPKTGLVIANTLLPNIQLRTLIQDWKANHEIVKKCLV